jgi:hypothetical protein
MESGAEPGDDGKWRMENGASVPSSILNHPFSFKRT